MKASGKHRLEEERYTDLIYSRPLLDTYCVNYISSETRVV
jgi:hypothetical protein